jgi:magnesium transporter
LEQDLDAARQMSRARANSITGPQRTSSHQNPRESPQAPFHPANADQPSAHVNDYLGVSAGVATAATQQHNAAQNEASFGPGNVAYGSSYRPNTSSFSPNSPLHSYQHQQAAQAQAARFYMQHRRQGSNTSVDSASHFIDHRNTQAPGHPVVPQLSPSSFNAGGIRRFSSARQQGSGGIGASALSTSMRYGQSQMEGSALDDENSVLDSQQARGPHLEHRGSTGEGNHSPIIHTPSRRPSLAEADVCFPMRTPGIEPVHPTGGEALSHDAIHLDPRGPYDHLDVLDHNDHANNEQPVLPPGFPWTFDLGALEEYSEQERKRLHEEALANAPPAGLRQRSGAATIATTREASRHQRRGSDFDRMLSGVSPDSDDATFYSRRPKKYTDAENSAATGKSSSRYQRKLALFEGGGALPPPIGSRSGKGAGILGNGTLMEEELARQRADAAQQNKALANNANTKTPLLDRSGQQVPSYHGPDWLAPSDDEEQGNAKLQSSANVPRSLSVGADLSNLVRRAAKGSSTSKSARRPYRRAHSGTHDKQFRFTFYSNALPNTIHARHLHELPAPGQTFEELLMGVAPRPAQDQNSGEKGSDLQQGDANETERRKSGGTIQSNQSVKASNQANSNGQTRPISALTSVMNAGRQEGATAPNTGSNTPDHGPNARSTVTGSTTQYGHGRSSNVGAASGTTAAAASLPAASIEKARALPGGGFRVEQDPETCTWWLDVLCPTDQEMKTLSRAFGIHPLTTEDILMEETREKIELFRNYYLVCFRSFDQDPYSPTYLEPLNMYVIVFREGTLSFHFRATPHPQNVRRRIKQLKDYINVTSDWISYALIDDITDAFGPLIQSIEYEVDSIDELVLILKETEQSDMLRRIGTCRKKVMGLLRLMGNKADVVKGLAKRCNENWSVAPKSDIGLYLSDIQDHLITMTQNLNHYEKILSRSHSNYLAQISIEMTDANNQINDVLSKLTALGTVIVPLNVITGLFGMNVHVPGQEVENLDWFFGIIGVMIFLAVLGYFATIRYLNK